MSTALRAVMEDFRAFPAVEPARVTPLTALRWIVIGVVVFAGVSMLRSARRTGAGAPS